MFKKLAVVTVLAITPVAAFAQNNPSGAQGGALSGATTGAVGGAIVGGPVGAAVGGVGGAVVGAIIGDQTQPRFRQYVVEQRVPSYAYSDPVAVGTVLPEDGVVYRQLPAEYGATQYRYTVVNQRPVVVDPQSRRIVQIIE